MVEAGEAILAYTRGGKGRFLADPMLQSAVERQFELVGMAAKRLSPGFVDAHPTLPWRSLVAVGDVLVHAVTPMDPEKLWIAVSGPLKQALPTLRELARLT